MPQTTEIEVDDLTGDLSIPPTPADQAMETLRQTMAGRLRVPETTPANPLLDPMISAAALLKKNLLASGANPEVLESYTTLICAIR